MQKFIKSIIVISFLSFSLCSQANDKLAKITFLLDWEPNTNHTGLYVAKKLGYFHQAGLDVDIIQTGDGNDVPAIIASNKAQFGIFAQEIFADALGKKKPFELTAVAAIIAHNPTGIISLKEKNITSPKNMQGYKYATWESPVSDAILAHLIKKEGGDFKNIKLIPTSVTDVVGGLKSNQVDTVWVYYGWEVVDTIMRNVPVNFFYIKDFDDTFDYYAPIIIASNKYLKENPTQARAFMKAVQKGYEYAIKDPVAAAKILTDAVPELDKNFILASQKHLSKTYQADAPYWGYINDKRWNKFYQWLNTTGILEEKIPANFGFTNQYID